MRSLYAKFYILMIVVVVATMLGLYGQYTHSRTLVYDSAQKIADVSVNVLKEEIEGWLSQKAQMIDDLAAIISINRLNNEELLAYMKVFLHKNPAFASIYFGSKDNVMINASGWVPPPGFDLRTRPWYVTGNALIYTDAFVNASKDDLIVTIAKPVYTSEGELVGVIAGDVSVKTILKLVQEKKIGGNGYSFLVDGNNKMLAHPDYRYDLKRGAPELNEEYLSFAKLVKQVPGGVVRYSLNGKDGFVAYHQIENTTWMLGSFVSLEDLINHTEQMTQGFLLALAVSAVILGVLFFLLAKFVIAPLVQLNDSVKQINVEKYPDYRIPVSGNDEVAMVSRTINHILSKAGSILSQLRADDEEIRNREEKLVNIIKGTHAGTWEWNVQTGETVINERWAEILGYALEELQPFNTEKWKQMTHPEDLAKVEKSIQQHFRRESEYCKCDSRLRHKNGSWVWVYDCGKVTAWDEGGRPLNMFGTRTDITERMKTEEELRESEERFRAYFQENKSMMLLVDWETFCIVDANPAAADYYGYSIAQLKQMKIGEINTLPMGEIVGKMENAVARRENGFLFPHRLANSEIRQVEVYLTPICENGKTKFLSIIHDVTDRILLETKIRESEANFFGFFNTSDDFLFVLDEEGRIILVNQTVQDRLGYTVKELTGQSVLMVHQEKERMHVGRIVQEMLAGVADYCPIPLISKNGKLIPVETRVTAGTWNGQPALFGVSKDISALKISQEKLARVFQVTASLIAISTLEEGIYLDVNDAFLHTLGFEREEVIGKRSVDLQLFQHTELRDTILDQLQREGSVHNLEVCVRAKDGATIFGLFSAVIVIVAAQQLLVTTVSDVTKLKQMEQELRESEERFSLSMDATHDGLWDWDVPTDSCYLSPGFYHILGYESGAFPMEIGSWSKLIHPEDRQYVEQLYSECMVGGCDSFATEFRMKTKHGEWRWVLSRGKVVMRNGQGRALRLVGTHVDITGRKQAEEAQHRNAQIQSVLREIAETASTASSLEELYDTVNRLTNQVLPSETFHLALLDASSNQIVDGYSRDTEKYVAKRRPVAKGLTEYALKQGRTIHITADTLQRLQECGEVIRQSNSPIHEWLGAPLLSSSGKGIGVLTVISRTTTQSFQASDAEVLAIIAAQVSMAIERKQAEAFLKSSQAHYRALVDQSFEALALVDIEKNEAIEVNRKFTELLGYSLPEDAPLYVDRYVTDTQRNLGKRYNVTLPQQRPSPIESQVLRHKNGTNVYVERAGTVIEIDGRDYLLASSRDMTVERRRQAELARDVEVARRVQRELLPQLTDSPLVAIRTLYHPSNIVSGDSYHMEWLNDGKLLRAFLIDVTGHGLATAIQTSSLNVLLREAAATKVPLLEMMQWINIHAKSCFAEGSYAAMLGFELDLHDRELRYVGAGITQFYVNYKKIATPGMFIGIWEKAEFGFAKMPISTGDILCFLTDGFTDALEQSNIANIAASKCEDFDTHVARLEQLAESGKLLDDATGICLQIRDLP